MAVLADTKWEARRNIKEEQASGAISKTVDQRGQGYDGNGALVQLVEPRMWKMAQIALSRAGF
jgi:hypothetical protein